MILASRAEPVKHTMQEIKTNTIQVLKVYLLARELMKNVASCDK